MDVAENLKKQQANIPGIRPGKQTADYIQAVMNRITFGGTSLMIVVGVALDTVNQIEAQLITRSYEGLTGPGAGRLRARRLPEG